MSRPTPTTSSPLDEATRSVRAPVLFVGAVSLFLNVLTFASPLFMLQVYDRVLTSRNETTLLMLVLIAVALMLSQGVLERLRHQILVRAASAFDAMLAGPAFDTALKASLRTRGGQHAQLLRDAESVREFIAGHGILTLCDAPWVPVFLAVCFAFDPMIGLVATSGAVVIFALAWINDGVTKGPLVKASRLNIAAYDNLAGSLRNAEAIVAMGMAPAFRDRWAARHAEAVSASVEANERGGGLLAVSKFIRMALQVGILATGAWLYIHGHVSGGVMFASSLIMGKALAPVEQAVGQWKALVTARAARERLRQAFAAFPATRERMRLPAPSGRLSVENVAVAVPGTQSVLVRNASFALEPGEILAVVGPTGSGKSTLARALVGAWPVAGGSVRIDGTDLRHWDPDQIGASIGYLPQDVELFEGTVAENIARFGAVDEAEVVRAATEARAHALVQRLPGGYGTSVGEDGVGLSGGQRQRVGLARAVYGNPALVVLDEPNSNLDGEGDQALVEALAAFKKAGKTVVVVTHKPNLLAVVDKVLVMQGGVAHKFGPRDEVLPMILGPRPAQQGQAAA